MDYSMTEDSTSIPRGTDLGERAALLYDTERRIAGGATILAACEASGLPRTTYYKLWQERPEDCPSIRRQAVEHLIQATKDTQDAALLARMQLELELQATTADAIRQGMAMLLNDLTNPERTVRDRKDIMLAVLARMRTGFVAPRLPPPTHEEADEMAAKAATIQVDLTQLTELLLSDGTRLSLTQPGTVGDTES